MIESDLLLLGLLREGPKHGYEIKIKIKEILSLFAGVNLKSIYYPLRILEKKALVAKRASKPTKRPERIVYALTPKGRKHFEGLLSKSFLNFKRPQFTLDLSLYFLHYMKPAIARRRLRARLQILKKIYAGLGQMANSLEEKDSTSLACILQHDRQMVGAELQFLANLTKTL